MEIFTEHHVIKEYIPIVGKRKRYPSGQVYDVQCLDWEEERKGYMPVVKVTCYEMLPVLIEPATYYEPEQWDVDCIGELYVEPKMRCWGKGIR